MRKKTAEHLKCRIIDYLLQIYPNIIIGNEIMFGSSRNSADLLAIIDNQIIAIEIKSKDDNLKRLPHQIEEYSKVYDKIIVFCSQDKIDETKKIIDGKPVGLYCISEDTIKKQEMPRINLHTKKDEMLASIPISYLKKAFNVNWRMNSDDARFLLSKKSKKQIHEHLLNFYIKKIEPSFSLYMKDKGAISCVDDLPILSREGTF